MQAGEIAWTWNADTIELGLNRHGQGPPVLLLPALSSISTRHEMRPLQEQLGQRYQTTTVDWPGFGDRPRPALDWTPQAYSAFVSYLLQSVVPRPHAVIAAGHAASYVLKHAAETANTASRLVLIAPTWRGPLPTMMDGRRPFFDRLCWLVDMPGLGALIYRLNVNRPVIRHMVAGHVFSDRAFLDRDRLRQKLTVVRPSGARHSSVRFVTGRLDPVHSRDEFLESARRAKIPILQVYGAEVPSRSRAEMEALAVLPEVRTVRVPRGKLSLHEEFPEDTFRAIEPFLSGAL